MHRLPTLVICFILFIFVAKAAFGAYMERRRSLESVAAARAELVRLQEREAFIQGELNRLSTEDGRKGKLREKFGVGLPGEQVAIIVEAQDDNLLPPEEGIFDKVKLFFENLFER